MTRTDKGKMRQELQVSGSFLFLLGAGFVLDHMFYFAGWLLVFAGAGLLVAAICTLRWPRASEPLHLSHERNASDVSMPADPK